uniref:Uncharacterized protein n=1 Tax=Cacopsylla melanoneura TaxID=428564 RepID=A0A8D8LTT0_9HEMI
MANLKMRSEMDLASLSVMTVHNLFPCFSFGNRNRQSMAIHIYDKATKKRYIYDIGTYLESSCNQVGMFLDSSEDISKFPDHYNVCLIGRYYVLNAVESEQSTFLH